VLAGFVVKSRAAHQARPQRQWALDAELEAELALELGIGVELVVEV
jgi:hypothetical protein